MHPHLQQIVEHIESQYGIEPDYLWQSSPGNAAFRHRNTRKWFACMMLNIRRDRLGLAGAGTVDIIDVKVDPEMVGSLIDGAGFLPAYHMNKQHWVTIVPEFADFEAACGLIARSYDLTRAQKKKS